jgi:hypothetical protein
MPPTTHRKSREIFSCLQFFTGRLPRARSVAAKTHNEGWLPMKTLDLENPEKPFLGRAPRGKYFNQRVRMSQLTRRQAIRLGIPAHLYDPNSKADVFHNWFGEFEEIARIDPEIVAANLVGPWTVINFITGRVGAGASLVRALAFAKSLRNPTDDDHHQLIEDLSQKLHIAWGPIALMKGDYEHPDLEPYYALEGKIAALDEWVGGPAVDWTISEIEQYLRDEEV